MKDALALGGDEGRDKLRKAAARGKYPLSSTDIRMGQPVTGDRDTGQKVGANPGN